MAVPDIFSRLTDAYGGSFTSDGAFMTFAATTSAEGGSSAELASGVGLLVQNISVSYQQNINRIYEIGTNLHYFIAGRTSGTMSVGRILGPRRVTVTFYRKFGNVCNAATNNVELRMTTGCTQVDSSGRVTFDGARDPGRDMRFQVKFAIINAITLSMNAQDMLVSEGLQMMFCSLLVDQPGYVLPAASLTGAAAGGAAGGGIAPGDVSGPATDRYYGVAPVAPDGGAPPSGTWDPGIGGHLAVVVTDAETLMAGVVDSLLDLATAGGFLPVGLPTSVAIRAAIKVAMLSSASYTGLISNLTDRLSTLGFSAANGGFDRDSEVAAAMDGFSEDVISAMASAMASAPDTVDMVPYVFSTRIADTAAITSGAAALIISKAATMFDAIASTVTA